MILVRRNRMSCPVLSYTQCVSVCVYCAQLAVGVAYVLCGEVRSRSLASCCARSLVPLLATVPLLLLLLLFFFCSQRKVTAIFSLKGQTKKEKAAGTGRDGNGIKAKPRLKNSFFQSFCRTINSNFVTAAAAVD